MSSGPDLYLVCKSCGAEVSPYITECPYCGTRIQKRAPKLDRGGVPKAAQARALAPAAAAPAPGRDPRHPRRPAPLGGLAARARHPSLVTLGDQVGPALHSTTSPRRRRSTSRGARSPRCSPTPSTGYEAIARRRDRPVRLAARAPPRLVGAAARLPRDRRRAARTSRSRSPARASRAAPTAPRSACSPRGRCATCSAAAAAARTTATCSACSRSPPCWCCMPLAATEASGIAGIVGGVAGLLHRPRCSRACPSASRSGAASPLVTPCCGRRQLGLGPVSRRRSLRRCFRSAATRPVSAPSHVRPKYSRLRRTAPLRRRTRRT